MSGGQLRAAASKGLLDAVAALLAYGVDPNDPDPAGGTTALHWAATEGHPAVADALVRGGAKVGVTDADGDTPLHAAAYFNQPSVAAVLLAAGADPSATNKAGRTPLEDADREGHGDVMRHAFAAHAATAAGSDGGGKRNGGGDGASDDKGSRRLSARDLEIARLQAELSEHRQQQASTHLRGSAARDRIDPALQALLAQYALGSHVAAALESAGVHRIGNLSSAHRRELLRQALVDVSCADEAEAERLVQDVASRTTTWPMRGGSLHAGAPSGGGSPGSKSPRLSPRPGRSPRLTRAGSTASSSSAAAAVAAAAAEAKKPVLLERADLDYDPLRPLSTAGGQKTVYRGVVRGREDIGSVAISVFRAHGNPDASFLAELKAIFQLDHPNVLRLVGFCVDGWILVTPLLPGDLFSSLHCEPKAGFDGPTRLRIMREVALGLQYIHTQRIEHRDLKSSNVLLDAGNHAKLIDFGLARVRSATLASTTLNGGAGGGTPAWAAPERLKKRWNREAKRPEPIDWAKADVYSLAMVCYEVATERVPFADLELETFDYPEVVAVERVRPDLTPDDVVPSVRALPSETVAALICIVASGWAHEPALRPPVAAFVDALVPLPVSPEATAGQ